MVTGEKPPGEKPPGEKLGQVSLGFRPGAFHRGANVRGAFHLEPIDIPAHDVLTRISFAITEYALYPTGAKDQAMCSVQLDSTLANIFEFSEKVV